MWSTSSLPLFWGSHWICGITFRGSVPLIGQIELFNHFLRIISFLHLIYFSFNVIFLMASFCATIRRDSVSLLGFPFLSHVHVFFACLLLEMSIQLFLFPFLSSRYCCSVDPCVSVCCNQSFFALFYVVFEMSYWCINVMFNAGKSSTFFSWQGVSSWCNG